jgi:tRNA1(Val) A37 N6-methylase TrmN6
VLCACYATSWAPRVERYCDLGSGIGSVAQLVAWRLPGARAVTIEAQEASLRLARKTAKYNGVDVTFHQGDVRDAAVLDEALKGGPFDLVTGAPPYWPVGTALASAHAQAIPARLEVRGDIADYARAAARILAVGGMFVCVFQASQDARVRSALDDAGLVLLRSRQAVFKEGAEAGVMLYAAARVQDVPSSFPRPGTVVEGKPVMEPPLVIRRADGSTHPEYATVRLSFGFPPGDVAG